jgi:hypothetical protein
MLKEGYANEWEAGSCWMYHGEDARCSFSLPRLNTCLGDGRNGLEALDELGELVVLLLASLDQNRRVLLERLFELEQERVEEDHVERVSCRVSLHHGPAEPAPDRERVNRKRRRL